MQINKYKFFAMYLLTKYFLLLICIKFSCGIKEVKLCGRKAERTVISLRITCFNKSDNNSMSCGKGKLSGFEELTNSDLLSATEIKLQNCSMKPRLFGSINFFRLHVFNSTPSTQNDVLYNETFLGLCSVTDISLRDNGINIIQESAFSCLSNVLTLDLSLNKIKVLPDNVFRDMKILSKLYLDSNNIHTLCEGVFDNLMYLQILFMHNNEISSLPDKVFHNVKNLQYLSLNNNKIEMLNEIIFSRLTEINHIDIRGNKIRNIRNVFSKCGNLIELRVSQNKALVLEEDSLRGLFKLEVLIANVCSISSLPNELFMDTHNIMIIQMNNNTLKEVNENTFAFLSNLQVLELSFNDISAFRDQPFKNNKIRYLYMPHNKLSEIKKDHFLGLSFMQALDVSSNNISSIEENTFDSMPDLVHLYLQGNSLSLLLGLNPFGSGKRLWIVDVSDNRLIDISNINWELFPNLQHFYAINNKLKELTIPNFASKNATLRFEQNNIRKLKLKRSKNGNVKPFNSKTYILLKGNPIQCDCHAYDLYTYLKNGFMSNVTFLDGLICKYPFKFQNIQLNTLNPERFMCNVLELCPDRCSCTYTPYTNARVANCSNKNYTYIPVQAPYNTNILDVSHNNITSLSGLKEEIWENLTEIYAEWNEITSRDFYLPQNVKTLHLDHNRLKQFPEAIKNPHKIKTGLKITISNNLFPCDCSIITLRKNISLFKDIKDLHCVFDNNSLSYVSVMELKESDVCPVFEYVQYAVSAIVLFLLISVIIFYYKHKLFVLSYLYSHFNACYTLFFCNKLLNEESLYDCFISYSSADREVTMAILEELENKPPFYKFCIHERNWLPGQYITSNIIESVQYSRKTLVVISKTFLKSPWFYLEFQAAYNKTLQNKADNLIIILKGGLPSETELNSDVLHVISSKTYLKWGERWFWEKLRYAIYKQNDSPEHKSSICFKTPAHWFVKKNPLIQPAIELKT